MVLEALQDSFLSGHVQVCLRVMVIENIVLDRRGCSELRSKMEEKVLLFNMTRVSQVLYLFGRS